MGLFDFSILELEQFLLVLFRIVAIFMTVPVFDSNQILPAYKILFCLMITLVIFPTVDLRYISFPPSLGTLVLYIIKELAVGFIIGFICSLIFAAIQMAAQYAGIQMGFGAASMMDPISNSQVIVVAQFQLLLATILFLALDGHHIFFRAMHQSFELVPLGGLKFTGNVTAYLVELSGGVITLAFKIAAPITAVMIMTNAALGVVARIVPQLNIFMVAFPLTIGVGLLVFTASLNVFHYGIKQIYIMMSDQLTNMINLMH
jgi:flagellar biosynthetic protein FliR